MVFSRILITSILFFFCIPRLFWAQMSRENYVQKMHGTELSINMVFIEEGTFFMGSDQQDWGHKLDESPKKEVQVSAFWMSDVEITWDLYNLFVSRELDNLENSLQKGTEVKMSPDAVTGATTPYVDMSFGMGVHNYPAISMTQLAASRFCQWLSALTGNFYRLPTEAEWEYACRAGSTSIYSFGNDLSRLDEFAWFSGNSQEKSQKVGQKKPNRWGLYDMHGNVAEWTLDHYLASGYNFEQNEIKDPIRMKETTYPKAVRGGSWQNEPIDLRSASRIGSSKKWKMRDPQIPKSLWWHTDAPFVGFRIVRPLKTPSPEEKNKYWNLK